MHLNFFTRTGHSRDRGQPMMGSGSIVAVEMQRHGHQLPATPPLPRSTTVPLHGRMYMCPSFWIRIRPDLAFFVPVLGQHEDEADHFDRRCPDFWYV